MDTAINNGDFLLDSRGRPFDISGVQEILQRALIRLTVKKGSFIYDTDFGSRIHTLKGSSGDIKTRALSIVKEALEPIDEIKVDDVVLKSTNGGENLQMKVLMSVYDKQGEVEIKL